MIITPKSLSVIQLLSAESEQYVVPVYQRRYSWHEKQLWDTPEEAISLIYDWGSRKKQFSEHQIGLTLRQVGREGLAESTAAVACVQGETGQFQTELRRCVPTVASAPGGLIPCRQ